MTGDNTEPPDREQLLEDMYELDKAIQSALLAVNEGDIPSAIRRLENAEETTAKWDPEMTECATTDE